MPRDGAGVFALDSGYFAVAGQVIQPSQHNPPLEDLAAAMTDSISRTGVTAVTANIPMGGFKFTGHGDATDGTDVLNLQTGDIRYLASVGQCRLTKDGSDLRLSRYNGLRLFINGTPESVPSAGITLAPSGLTAGTLYFIYAYMNGTTMTLEASTTAPATDATYGHQIKAGNATRSLVGMARPVAGPAWADSATQAFVRSYYNRAPVTLRGNFTALRTVFSTYAEVNAEIRVEFLLWSDDSVALSVRGYGFMSGPSYGYVAATVDARIPTATEGVGIYDTDGSGIGWSGHESGFANGYHFATVMAGRIAGTLTFDTVSGAAFTSLNVGIV